MAKTLSGYCAVAGGFQNWVTVNRLLRFPGASIMLWKPRAVSFNLNWFEFACDTSDCQPDECPCLDSGDVDCDGRLALRCTLGTE